MQWGRVGLVQMVLLGALLLGGNCYDRQYQFFAAEVEPPKVFDCFVYQGEEHLLTLKLQTMMHYVDYFIILEGELGGQVPFTFSRRRFLQYSHKILYLPIRTLPYRTTQPSQQQQLANREFIRNSYYSILNMMAHKEDILILGSVGTILTQSALQEFITKGYDYACTSLLFFSSVFNEMQVRALSNGSTTPSYWTQGARLLTYATLNRTFSTVSAAYASKQCEDPLLAESKIIHTAGWHFAAASQPLKSSIPEGVYLKTIEPNSPLLPEALIKDLALNGTASKYSSFLAGRESEARDKAVQYYSAWQTQQLEFENYKGKYQQELQQFKQQFPLLTPKESHQWELGLQMALWSCLMGFVAALSFYGAGESRVQKAVEERFGWSGEVGSRVVWLVRVTVWLGLGIWGLVVLFQEYGGSYHLSLKGISRRLVVNCFPYNGERHTLNLKLAVVHPYVDYYVITEGLYTHLGQAKALRFNYSFFEPYANKIIYFPLRNLPAPYVDLGYQDKWDNEEHMRDVALQFLKVFALDHDVILTDDTDEMAPLSTYQKFNPGKYSWTSLQVRLHYAFYNRRSVFDQGDVKAIPNYWYTGAKFITMDAYINQLNGVLTAVRRSIGCEVDTRSWEAVFERNISCKEQVIRQAGWHFSYVLSDSDLLRKYKSYADNTGDPVVITDFTKKRLSNLAIKSYLQDMHPFSSNLPLEMLMDLYKHKNQSEFAPYLSAVDVDQLFWESIAGKGRDQSWLSPLGWMTPNWLYLGLLSLGVSLGLFCTVLLRQHRQGKLFSRRTHASGVFLQLSDQSDQAIE